MDSQFKEQQQQQKIEKGSHIQQKPRNETHCKIALKHKMHKKHVCMVHILWFHARLLSACVFLVTIAGCT